MAEDSDDKAYISVEGRCIGLKSGSEFTPLGNFNFTIKHFVGGDRIGKYKAHDLYSIVLLRSDGRSEL